MMTILSGATGLLQLMVSNDFVTRVVFGLIIFIILCSQTVIHFSQRRPKWFRIAELIALTCSFIAMMVTATAVRSPNGLALAGLFMLLGVVEVYATAAVYSFLRNRAKIASLLASYWVVPVLVLGLFILLFYKAEAIRVDTVDANAILKQTERNEVVTKEVVGGMKATLDSRSKVADSQRQVTINKLDGLSDDVYGLLVPMRVSIIDIKSQQQRVSLEQQRLGIEHGRMLEEQKRTNERLDQTNERLDKIEALLVQLLK